MRAAPASHPALRDFDREIDEIVQQLHALREQREELLIHKGPDHPELREVIARRDRLIGRLLDLRARPPHREGPETFVPPGQRPPGPHQPPPVEDVLMRLRQERPEVYERLMVLRREHPERFQEELPRVLRSAGAFEVPVPPPGPERRRMEMEEMRERDPERFKLVQRDEQLMDRAVETAERCRRTAEPERRKELEAQLREILNQQFDTRMEIRRLEVKDLKQRLDDLTAGLEKRAKDKPNLVDRRLKQMLNPDEAEW